MYKNNFIYLQEAKNKQISKPIKKTDKPASKARIGINSADKSKISENDYENLREDCANLETRGFSLRKIAEYVSTKYAVRISKDSVQKIIRLWRDEQVEQMNLNDLAYQRVVTLGELNQLQSQIQKLLRDKVVVYKTTVRDKETGGHKVIEKRREIAPSLYAKLLQNLLQLIMAKARIRGVDNPQIIMQIIKEANIQNNPSTSSSNNFASRTKAHLKKLRDEASNFNEEA